MKKYFVFTLLPLIFSLFFSCASTRFTITDEMMDPIVEEQYEKMEEAILKNWTAKRKASIIVFFCYDQRFGPETVTVISHWIQNDLEQRFIESGKFKIIDTQNLDRILKEQKFQQSGYVSDEVMVDMGRQMGGNYMIISKISQYNLFETRVTNIESAELIYSDAEKISDRTKISR